MKTHHIVLGDGKPITVTLTTDGKGRYLASTGEETLELDVADLGQGEFHLLHGTRSIDLWVGGDPSQRLVHIGQAPGLTVQVLDEQRAARQAMETRKGGRSADGQQTIKAPMPGRVVKCLVAVGDRVNGGQGIIVVEAMKMENELRTPSEGTVQQILVQEGRNVEAGEALVIIG